MFNKPNQACANLLNTTKEFLLSLADLLWTCVVVAPLVVLYWRGSWDLLDDLVYPFTSDVGVTLPFTAIKKQKSGLVCYLVGLLIRVSLDLSKFHIGEFLGTKHKLIRFCCGWIFNAIYALAGVSFWRGVWFLMKLDIGVGTVQLLVVHCGSLLVLVFTNVPKSLISPPLSISLDNHQTTFQIGTFFRKTPDSGIWFVIDVIFTNLIVRQLIVFCWWSLWSLENKFLLTNYIGMQDYDVSYDSLLIGYAGTMLTCGLDRLVLSFSITQTQTFMLKFVRTLVTVLAFFSSVNVWRGVWSMLDHYFLPGVEQDVNYMIGHVIGLVALTVIMAANTISNDNIVLDSETTNTVNIDYWSKKSFKEEEMEMVAILD